jgi:hypothetical protein
MLLRERPEPVYWDEAGDVQMQMGGAITLTAEYHPYVDLSSIDCKTFFSCSTRELGIVGECAGVLDRNKIEPWRACFSG